MEEVRLGLVRIFGWNVLGKVFGNLRTALYLVWFGLTLSMDHFYVAFGLVAGLMSATTQVVEMVSLPHLAKARDAGKGFASGTLTTLCLSFFSSILVLSLLWLFHDPVIRLVATGATVEDRAMISNELFYLFAFGLLFSLSSICGGIISTSGSYSHFHFVNCFTIVGSLFFLVLYHRSPTDISVALAIGLILGLAIQIAFLIRKKLVRLAWDSKLFPKLLKSAVTLFWFVAGVQAISITDRSFATKLEAGSVSVFYYTSIVVTLPVVLLGLHQVLLPMILNLKKGLDWRPLARLSALSASLGAVFLFLFGGSFAVIVLQLFAIRGVEEQQWIDSFRGLGLFLIPYVVWMLASRICQARSKYGILGFVGLGGALLNVLLNHLAVTVLDLGLLGLGVASVVTMTFMAVLTLLSAGISSLNTFRELFWEARLWWFVVFAICTIGILGNLVSSFFAGCIFLVASFILIGLFAFRHWAILFPRAEGVS